MEYQLKNDSIEAWRIGSEPVPAWVGELIADKTIRGKLDTQAFSVATDDGPRDAKIGDYLAYSPTVWGEPTEDAPQGEIRAYRSVKFFPQGEFQKLYDVPADEAQPLLVEQSSLVATGESARPLAEPEKDRAAIDALGLDATAESAQPPMAAEEPQPDEAPALEIHEDDLEPYEPTKSKRKR